MKMNMKLRALTLVATVGLLGGTAFVASGATGAYFSDSVTGHVSGTLGTIQITTPGSTPYVSLTDLLPGTPQSMTVDYTNSGNSPEDVWLDFNNATALSALNNLGHYGSVTITSSGWGTPPSGLDFFSNNLDDNSAPDACGAFSVTGCNPLPSTVMIASNVPAGKSGSYTFTFEYASATTPPASSAWNPYPLPGDANTSVTYAACETAGGTHSACSDNQVTINPADASGTGLPYQLVATQVGIAPGAPGSKF